VVPLQTAITSASYFRAVPYNSRRLGVERAGFPRGGVERGGDAAVGLLYPGTALPLTPCNFRANVNMFLFMVGSIVLWT